MTPRIIAFLATRCSMADVKALVDQATADGMPPTEISTGSSLGALLPELTPDDTVVCCMAECFASLSELLSAVAQTPARVYLVDQPMFSQIPLTHLRLLCDLGTSLHAARTQKGLAQAALRGKKPGRTKGSTQLRADQIELVNQVDELRAQQGINLRVACDRVGISAGSYYQYKKRR